MSSFHRPCRSARPSRAVLVAACLGVAVTLTGCGDSAEPVSADTAPSESPASSDATPDPGATSVAPSTDSSTGTSASSSPSTSTSTSAGSSPSTPATPPAGSAPTTAAPDRPGEVIAYAGGESPGVLVRGPRDAAQLRRSPAAFKRFIGRTAQRVVDHASCSEATVGIMVEFVSTAGYAVGSVNECGGYAALWASVDGRWREIEGTQDAWDCAVLEHYAVPSDLVGDTCYDYDAKKERRYHQV
ncbi:hypothetical protein [Nocardioides sp.]|uniref:hypothetical protein n=1 Tax=Nocardioides sp. TaxID=35761 RepID=UPI0025E46136|nr:hypothetical protein [Nocardioides sp.]